MAKHTFLTMKARKRLARAAVQEANGNTRSTAALAKARQIIEEIVNDEPARYINFFEKYCTPKDSEIVTETAKRLQPPQPTLF